MKNKMDVCNKCNNDPLKKEWCQTCKGKGVISNMCFHCLGEGVYPSQNPNMDGEYEECSFCKGKGVIDIYCNNCIHYINNDCGNYEHPCPEIIKKKK